MNYSNIQEVTAFADSQFGVLYIAIITGGIGTIAGSLISKEAAGIGGAIGGVMGIVIGLLLKLA